MQFLKNTSIIVMVFLSTISNNLFAGDTHIGKSVEHGAKSGSHASASAAHSIAGSAQVVSAVSSIPFAIVGSVGSVSAEISKELLNAATAPIGTPLKITDETVMIGVSPDKALNNNP